MEEIQLKSMSIKIYHLEFVTLVLKKNYAGKSGRHFPI